MEPGNLAVVIKNKALNLGYDLCGFTDVESMGEYADHLNERINDYPKSQNLY